VSIVASGKATPWFARPAFDGPADPARVSPAAALSEALLFVPSVTFPIANMPDLNQSGCESSSIRIADFTQFTACERCRLVQSAPPALAPSTILWERHSHYNQRVRQVGVRQALAAMRPVAISITPSTSAKRFYAELSII
jgi:hypothetical protein